MKTAGATDTRIIQKEPDPADIYMSTTKVNQMPLSAKTLSKKSLEAARRIQSAVTKSRSDSAYSTEPGLRTDSRMDGRTSSQEAGGCGGRPATATTSKSVSISVGKPPRTPSRAKSRPTSFKSGTQSAYSVVGFQLGRGDADSEASHEEEIDLRRRVSWAFEDPFLPKPKELDLGETKNLLRSQIRARGEVVPPDFIYLAVNSIQSNMKRTEVSKNMENNRREQELAKNKSLGRPSSSPSRIDPRTKLPMADLGLDDFKIEQGVAPDLRSEAGSGRTSRMSQGSKARQAQPGIVPTSKSFITNFTVTPVTSKPKVSVYPSTTASSIPAGRVVRPHTASMVPVHTGQELATQEQTRSQSALAMSRPGTAKTGLSMAMSGVASANKCYHGHLNPTTEASFVPMLMYPKDMNEKLRDIKQKRIERLEQMKRPVSEPAPKVGKVSAHNDPLRSHVDFKLRTHCQVEQELANIAKIYVDQKKKIEMEKERKQKSAWLSKVKKQVKAEKEETMRPHSGPARLRTS